MVVPMDAFYLSLDVHRYALLSFENLLSTVEYLYLWSETEAYIVILRGRLGV